MKLTEAIKLLQGLQGETPEQLATPMQQALSLGIEALKSILLTRENLGLGRNIRLAGETEEKERG